MTLVEICLRLLEEDRREMREILNRLYGGTTLLVGAGTAVTVFVLGRLRGSGADSGHGSSWPELGVLVGSELLFLLAVAARWWISLREIAYLRAYINAREALLVRVSQPPREELPGRPPVAEGLITVEHLLLRHENASVVVKSCFDPGYAEGWGSFSLPRRLWAGKREPWKAVGRRVASGLPIVGAEPYWFGVVAIVLTALRAIGAVALAWGVPGGA